MIEIEYIYGAVLTVIFYTLLFGSSFPLVYAFGFISLFVLYWSFKYVFIEFCQKPLAYNHSFNEFVIRILFAGIIMHCVITPVFFKAENIAGNDGKLVFFERLLSMGYYLAVIIIVLLYVFLRKPMIVLWREYQSYRSMKNNKEEENGETDPSKVSRKQYSLPTIIQNLEVTKNN